MSPLGTHEEDALGTYDEDALGTHDEDALETQEKKDPLGTQEEEEELIRPIHNYGKTVT